MKKTVNHRTSLNIEQIFRVLNPQQKPMINLTEAFNNTDNLSPKYRDILQPLLQECATKKRLIQIPERDLRMMFNNRRQQTFSNDNRYRTTGRSASRLKRRVRELSLERSFIQQTANYMGRRNSVKTPRSSISKLKESLRLDLSVLHRPKESKPKENPKPKENRSVLTMLNHTPHNVSVNVKF